MCIYIYMYTYIHLVDFCSKIQRADAVLARSKE